LNDIEVECAAGDAGRYVGLEAAAVRVIASTASKSYSALLSRETKNLNRYHERNARK
jgi:hypothetical protein